MPPAIAVVVWSALLVLLLRYDSRKDPKVSPALWIPAIWMFFLGSRTAAQWLGATQTSVAAAFMEGNNIDRGLSLGLMALAICVLIARRTSVIAFVVRNPVVAAFLVFALASVTWSDYPLVSFKRWVRDLGTYFMVILVLSDPRPLEAICAVVRRSSYLLLFLSVVLIKYFPAMGVLYDAFSGLPEYAGATTSKNMLGVVCLISGTFYFWDTLRRWPERRAPGGKLRVIVNIALITMTLWLLRLSNSATSQLCLVIGCGVVALFRTKWAFRHPRGAIALIPTGIVIYAVLESTVGLSGLVAEFFGRDPTLHGRTGIWSTLLSVQTHPLVGVGYQSFWVGERLQVVWQLLNVQFLNEAHNGYLEIYLSLGAIGLTLMVAIMLTSFVRISRRFAVSPSMASLGLALWSIMVVYNFAESAFAASLLWTVFLFCSIASPKAMEAEEAANQRQSLHSQTARAPFDGHRWRPGHAHATRVSSTRPASASTATHVRANPAAARFARLTRLRER